FNHLAFCGIDDIHAICAADGHANIATVGRGRTLVGPSGQRDRVHNFVAPGIDHFQIVFGFDGGEESSSIGRGAMSMHLVAHAYVANHRVARDVNDADVVTLAVADVELGDSLPGRITHAGRD